MFVNRCHAAIGASGLLFMAGIAGCAAPLDLSAVSQYASTTAQAGAAFAALAADFKGSCIRYNEALGNFIEASSSSPTTLVVVGDASPAPLTAAVSVEDVVLQSGYKYTAPSSSPTGPPAAVSTSSPVAAPIDAKCATAADVSTGWQSANGAVLAYVQALGNLANVDGIPTPNPSPLASGLSKVGVSSAAVQAVSGLITSIGTYFEGQARDRAIASFLKEADAPLGGVGQALEVVDAAYAITLQNEFNEIKSQYSTFAGTELDARAKITGSDGRSVRRRRAITERLAVARAATMDALALINQRRGASVSYGSAIEQILKTHQELYEASQKRATFADYLNIFRTTGVPVVTNLQNLAKAVK